MKTLYYFVIVLLFFSCGSTKKVKTQTFESTKQSVFENQREALKIDQVVTTDSSLEQVQLETEDYFARLTVFDTSLPVNEVTGKPPIASELIIKGRRNNYIKADSKSLIQADTEVNYSSASDLKSDLTYQQENVERKSDSTNNPSKFFNDLTKLILLILLLVFLVYFRKPFYKLLLICVNSIRGKQ